MAAADGAVSIVRSAGVSEGDIDEQFKDLLHLSAEEAEYIRNTLNK